MLGPTPTRLPHIRRFGGKCKFHHPLDTVTPLNNYGLPLRLAAPVCEFFCKTGFCRFGVSCVKHHPNLIPGPIERGLQPGAPTALGNGMVGDRGGPRPGTGTGGWDAVLQSSPFEITDNLDGFFEEFAVNPGKDVCPNFKRTGNCKCAVPSLLPTPTPCFPSTQTSTVRKCARI